MTDEHPPANLANLAMNLAGSAELAAALSPPTRGSDGRFLTGNNGGGRPKGSRNRLTDSFLAVIADDFAQHGAEAVSRVRHGDPVAYLKLVVSIIPREMVLQHEQEPNVDFDNLTLAELMELIEQARRRSVRRRALIEAERG